MVNFKYPKVTVLMPVYNCELYIKEAVESVLNQTFKDFEFLIIDDASTDKTVHIIKSYNDARIQLIKKPVNTGYTNSLNYGLKIAKGEYIARMDGDDISLPERFEKQVAFLDAHPNVILCGTLYQIIGTNKVCDHPLSHNAIKVKLISACYIAHPTVMFQKRILETNRLQYDSVMEPAEDYDLWSRLVFLGELANIGEVLLYYRTHPQQTSIIRSTKQNKVSREVRIRMLTMIDPLFDAEVYSFDLSAQNLNNQFVIKKIKSKIDLFDSLVILNNQREIYDEKLFLNYINQEKKYLYNLYKKKSVTYSLGNIFLGLIKYPDFFKKIGIKETGEIIVKSVFYRMKAGF
ncbi:glycosyltransferase family 2 protein [Flavobacterium gilvum]|uniref:Glycosyltransferase 2-like domain-containing protein n=1 Tax=Flavobacterium gilvum TaxID=1492737 RepID=A0AAC9I291_9FLAO|nr:glycosyltransferase [Flavobacterium gilvum]AOW08136.1 hypothetical protein EM308_00670 [Flavobacterium gilvum]KFC59372.1 hypothetical protein FEM08_19760 [Flavobacterium gilvum]